MTTNERCEVVADCRYVDEVYKSPPFYPTIAFVDSLKVCFISVFWKTFYAGQILLQKTKNHYF